MARKKRQKPFLLRVDKHLLDAVETWAQDELRSLNGQIEWLLRDALGRRKGNGRRAKRPDID